MCGVVGRGPNGGVWRRYGSSDASTEAYIYRDGWVAGGLAKAMYDDYNVRGTRVEVEVESWKGNRRKVKHRMKREFDEEGGIEDHNRIR